MLRKLLHHVNIVAQCRKLNQGIHTSLWWCPQFVLLVSGVVIIGVIVLTYHLGKHYVNLEIITLIVLFVSVFLFIISFIIVRAFEHVVQLRQQEAAQSAEILKLRDEFVYLAVHELRSPATGIKWALGSLRMKYPNLFEQHHDTWSIIHDNTEQLLLLVKNILKISQLENGTLQINGAPLAIQEVVERVMAKLTSRGAKRHITIHTELPTAPLMVMADQILLTDICHELLTNALKFSPEESHIHIHATGQNTHETNGTTVLIAITNDAFIAPDEAPNVFKKFGRTETATSCEGSGLGLFIAHRTATQMGGRLWFESSEDTGTTFFLSLPAS